MTTREIRAHVEELYGVTVSRELISKVTDEVHEELREWRSRPLEAVYPIVYFDALRVKIREEGLVQNKAVHLAIGVTALGRKEILGMWTAANEGAKFWLGVMNELKARGVRDVLIVVVDGVTTGIDELRAGVEERIRLVAAMRGRTTGTLLLPTRSGWPGTRSSFRVCIAQTVVPDQNDLKSLSQDPTLSSRHMRRKHRRHLSAALEAVKRIDRPPEDAYAG